MSKLAQTSVKYVIKTKITADGVVERPDVIGALFGQTEGLLGQELDLRELQRTGKIGRLEVKINSQKGKSDGIITIPSSLDSTETTLIASALETIDRVGPCNAKIVVEDIEDLRTAKRKYITDRAKSLLANLLTKIPETSIVTEELKQAVRSSEIINYVNLPAGPEAPTSDALVIVEGRADVVNLLKHGIKNAIAIEGTSVPPQISGLSKEREITVFLDGDRGGDLILKELRQLAEIDFVARAPQGKEVEELTKKEIFKAMRDRVTVEQSKDVGNGFKTYSRTPRTPVKRMERRPPPRRSAYLSAEKKKFFKEQLNELIGTRAASIFDSKLNFYGRVPAKELGNALKQVENPNTIILDGYIDEYLVNTAIMKGVKYLVGTKIKDRIPTKDVTLLSAKDL